MAYPGPDLSEVPVSELIERARSVATNTSLMLTRGALVAELRARGMKWHQIRAETGIPPGSGLRWQRAYEKSRG